MTQKIEVKQVEGQEVAVEVLATAIVDIHKAVEKMLKGRLTERALVLLSHATQQPQHRVECVLNALEQLEDIYLKKAPR